MTMRTGLRPNLLLILALLVVNVSTAVAQVAIPATVRPDFNNDGRDDLAVGVPGENTAAGGVHIIYGSKAGLTDLGDQFFTQNSSGVPGAEEDYDQCGTSLATGDFDGDGYTDLAFGCPGEDAPSVSASGAVMVLYGSPVGLTSSGSQFWSQNSPDVNGASETLDRCGASLVAGDFDRDGFADLAFGCPGEDVGSAEDAGAVSVLFGSSTGLTAARNRFLSQDTSGIPDAAEGGDSCGTTLAAGDFNGDGRTDLAFGCPGEDLGLLFDAGAVSVAYGSSVGFTGASGGFLHQNYGGAVSNGDEAFDKCGQGLAAGDFNADGRDDVVFGCPGEDIIGPIQFDVGSAQVMFGTNLIGVFSQGGIRITTNEARCGAAITVGDFNGDTFDDFALGCTDSNSGAGKVWVEKGGPGLSGLSFEGTFTQNSEGVADASEAGDNFGHAVSAGDFDGDGFSDLAVGVPNEDQAAGNNVGAVNVIYGPFIDFAPERNQFFTQNAAGIVDASEAGDNFGFSLAGSGGTPLPGLTGLWTEVALSCRGASENRCVVTGTFTVINPSLGATPRVVVRFYLSDDQLLDGADDLIAETAVKPLDMNESQVRKLNVPLSDGVNGFGRFLIAFVDAEDIVVESNEANNIIVSESIE
jgi:hypothetical protein